MDLMKAFTEKYTKEEPPVVQVGDTVRVHLKVKEGNRERIQVFEGTVIAKKHGGIEETFTVRRISYGIGVEKVFPLHAPSIEKVEVVRHGKVRRAKLYYLRGRVGKAAKIKEALWSRAKKERFRTAPFFVSRQPSRPSGGREESVCLRRSQKMAGCWP